MPKVSDGSQSGASYDPELILQILLAGGGAILLGPALMDLVSQNSGGGGGGGSLAAQARINKTVTKIGPIIGDYNANILMLLGAELMDM